MVITHHGGQFFKVTFGDTTIAFDPIAKKSKLDSAKFGADIVFISLNHENFNGVEQVTHGSKAPFEVWGPGEYEFGNVTARGYGVKTIYDKVERYNTIYQVRMEDINMIFLAHLVVLRLIQKS
ncbi:MAG: MBL fold metallo-hydrolase [Candidatus Paceibacterota bacterium]